MEEQLDNNGGKHPKPPFPKQEQSTPGSEKKMHPKPDHGEKTYKGNGLLKGKKAIITGGDSGIGKAVAIAYAREGADVLLIYFKNKESEDALDTKYWVEREGREAILMQGDIKERKFCEEVVEKAVSSWGKVDVLINNAAYQMTYKTFEEISDEEWLKTFDTNVHGMFYMCKLALPYISEKGTIINTSSINSYDPNPTLLPYALTKGVIHHFTYALNALLHENKKQIRVNSVAPGPVWTSLIPSTIPDHENFGKNNPMGRPAQPSEIAPSYVFLADDSASYIAGTTIAVTGGRNTL